GLERDRRGTGEGQSPKNPQKTAEEIVNNWAEKDIEKILMEYGEERFAKRIAKKISEERKVKTIKTTFQLVEVIKRAVPVWEQKKKRHFAAKTFQALRIAVNDELNNLKKALPQALELLKPGGRLVAISFHSLEDRIVKHFFHKYSPFACKILTKKPLLPSKEETKINPRSRSAKLRAAVKQ
ncbi:16S rRNA (cytosine(1402)-N(4))-methyltransferase RsmH, partial [Patescibacteria group bacterium]|nr:16S rRNA (cytosine(1402)-N(4))-methyltransferase RsmH [Patescibacteria group bacterium]